MSPNSDLPNRRSLRLNGYDYSLAGAYFITIVTHKRKNLLGSIQNDKMRISDQGKILQYTWNDLPNHFPSLQLDEFIIMPNHVHAILIINWETWVVVSGQPEKVALGEIVRALKSYSARRINKLQGTPGTPFWQRGYHDRVIRNEKEWEQIREYILTNPLNWKKDTEYLM